MFDSRACCIPGKSRGLCVELGWNAESKLATLAKNPGSKWLLHVITPCSNMVYIPKVYGDIGSYGTMTHWMQLGWHPSGSRQLGLFHGLSDWSHVWFRGSFALMSCDTQQKRAVNLLELGNHSGSWVRQLRAYQFGGPQTMHRKKVRWF
jgi:hypothetical protein